MVKVFMPNEKGKIEFTKEELELLLNEVWNDGYYRHSQYWWPYQITTTTVPHYLNNSGITITCGEENR